MRFYPLVLLVALIALASSARLSYSKIEVRSRHELATHEEIELSRSRNLWDAVERWWTKWNKEFYETCGCEWRRQLNQARAERQKLQAVDSVFYSCIAGAGLIVFLILWSSSEKEWEWIEIKYSDRYLEESRQKLERDLNNGDWVKLQDWPAMKYMVFKWFKWMSSEEALQRRFPIKIRAKAKEPSLSVFHHLGTLYELRKHRTDLMGQLDTIVRDNQGVLSTTLGNINSFTSRRMRLKELLCSALRKENLRESKGAKALLFFLEIDDGKILAFTSLFELFLVIAISCLAQTVFPVYFYMDGSKDFYCSTLGSTPIIKDPHSLARGIAKLVIVMIVFLSIWSSHQQKVEYASQQPYRFPYNWLTMLGDCVTVWSTLISAFAANTVIWVPQILLNVVGYALVVLAIYYLNVLVIGAVFRDFESFQEWGRIGTLLENCPLSIRDLVNTDATEDVGLIVIETGDTGELLSFMGKKPCETRLKVFDDAGATSVTYRVHQETPRTWMCSRMLFGEETLPTMQWFGWRCRTFTKVCVCLPCLLSVATIFHTINWLQVPDLPSTNCVCR